MGLLPVIFGILPIQAQVQNRGLIISPIIFELQAKPDSVYTLELQVTNDTSEDRTGLRGWIQTFEASGEAGTPILREFTPEDMGQDWIQFTESSFDLKSGETKTLQIKIAVPATASSGSYFFAPTVAIAAPSAGSNNIVIEQRLSALVFLEVIGQTDRKVRVENFSLQHGIVDPFFDYNKLYITIRVDGRSYYKPSGQIVVTGPESVKNSVNLNPREYRILPNTARSYDKILQPIITNERLPAWLQNRPMDENVDWIDLPKVWLGRQDIGMELVFVSSEGQLEKITATTSVFYLPWKVGILALAVVLILAGGYYYLVHKPKKSKI